MSSIVYKILPAHYLKYQRCPTESDFALYLNDNNKKILFTCAPYLNDPLECRVLNFEKHFHEAYGASYTQLSQMPEMKKILEQNIHDPDSEFWRLNLQLKFGIFSLATNCSSSAMWAHYGAGHTGYAVGFKSNHRFFKGQTSPLEITPLRSVDYRRTPPEFSADNLFSAFFTKGIEWAYEEEVRMVIGFEDVANPHWLDDPKFGVETKFDGDVLQGLFVELPHDAIENIVVGWHASKRFVGHLQKRAVELGVPLRFACPSKESFNMLIEDKEPNLARRD